MSKNLNDFVANRVIGVLNDTKMSNIKKKHIAIKQKQKYYERVNELRLMGYGGKWQPVYKECVFCRSTDNLGKNLCFVPSVCLTVLTN